MQAPRCIVVGLVLCSGCATTSAPYEVTSNPPGATIMVNGKAAGTTPTTVYLAISRRWAGIGGDEGGWSHGGDISEVTVSPRANGKSTAGPQTQRVVATPKGGKLFFDLRQRGAATRPAP